jgi:hypothetical protein
MFAPGFLLSTRHHLEAAMFNRSNVSVWQSGELIEYGGRIEKLTHVAVTINGAHYFLETCEFRIR